MLLYAATIVSSAFLLFLVQPVIAKQILPWFGGSAAVWTTCVVFFQVLLLAGYAYAHALTRRAPRTQALVHAALLLASLAFLPIIPADTWKPDAASDPLWRILGLLFATIGLPYFLLSSTGPLIQNWFAQDRAQASRARQVYRLFALSNFGSLVGLLIYPFVVEPYVNSQVQSWAWSALYASFVLTCAACAWRARTSAALPVARDEHAGGVSRAPGFARRMFWMMCAALGSLLLLAITSHITQNVASIPFLWVLPLALYLLSFVLVFEGRAGRGWYVRRWWLAPVSIALVAMAWALSAHRGVLDIHIAIPIFCVGLFLACVFCHGELAATKPEPAYLTQFYLALSAGGALGGLFVALVAPRVFDNYWETPIGIVALAFLALATVRDHGAVRWGVAMALACVIAALVFVAIGGAPFEALRVNLPLHETPALTIELLCLAALVALASIRRGVPAALVTAALICSSFYGWKYYRFLSEETLSMSRNFYGTLRVKQTGPGANQTRRLLHGVILHGDQFVDAARRRTPTTYYGPTSGIALTLRMLRPDAAPLKVAMIGLGTGTLAAWGRSGDIYRIYELDGAVLDIARRRFTYLADSRARIEAVLGDARLSMERELAEGRPQRFDVIAVDAFSSDSIPVHLITREALAVFARHLAPDGVVAFHVSNRFLQLAPVVAQLAADAGLEAVDIHDDPEDSDVYSSSEWVLVTNNDAFLDRDEILDAAVAIEAIPGLPIWTDQFNNLFKILK